MAEIPDETLAIVAEPHTQGHETFPTQVSSQVSADHLQLGREHISEIIRNQNVNISDFRVLLNNESSSVLAEPDSNGRNVLMEIIYSENVGLLSEMPSLLGELHNILYQSQDNLGNNCLQLALRTGDETIVSLVWDDIVTSNTHKQAISDMITHRNFAEENAYSIALSSKHAYKWCMDFRRHMAFTKDNVKTLWILNNDGQSTLVKAVLTNNHDIACELMGHVLRLCKDKLDEIYTQPIISGRNIGGMMHPHPVRDGPQDVDICLLDLLMMKREKANESEIDRLLMYYAVNMVEYNDPFSYAALEHYQKIVSPRRVGEKSLLSMLIEKDCHEVVKSLLDTVQFRKTFWQQIDAPDGLFTRSYLEAHAMDSKMVSILHTPPAAKFLNLTNHSKARPQALMFYTEMHTKQYEASRREGATKCQDFKDCLEEIRMKCGVLSGEKKCLRKADIMHWLRDELEKIRDCTSMLIIARFSHGEEGILFDSDMDPIAIRDIVSLANKHMYTGIPICFMLQACREKPSIGLPPSVGLQRYNVLIRTCGEGEKSCRGVYTGEFAQRVRFGGRDIQRIHQDVVEFIVNHNDMNISTQTPEITHLLTKKELCLPN